MAAKKRGEGGPGGGKHGKGSPPLSVLLLRGYHFISNSEEKFFREKKSKKHGLGLLRGAGGGHQHNGSSRIRQSKSPLAAST